LHRRRANPSKPVRAREWLRLRLAQDGTTRRLRPRPTAAALPAAAAAAWASALRPGGCAPAASPTPAPLPPRPPPASRAAAGGPTSPPALPCDAAHERHRTGSAQAPLHVHDQPNADAIALP